MPRLLCAVLAASGVLTAVALGRGATHRASADANLVVNGTFDANRADWDIDSAGTDADWLGTAGNPSGSARVFFTLFGTTSGDLIQCLSGIEPGMLVTVSGDVVVPNDDPQDDQPGATEAALGIAYYPDSACSDAVISSDETSGVAVPGPGTAWTSLSEAFVAPAGTQTAAVRLTLRGSDFCGVNSFAYFDNITVSTAGGTSPTAEATSRPRTHTPIPEATATQTPVPVATGAASATAAPAAQNGPPPQQSGAAGEISPPGTGSGPLSYTASDIGRRVQPVC